MRTSFLACSRYTAIFALIFIVAVGAGAYAQVSNPQVRYVTTDPSGACGSASYVTVNRTTGSHMGCVNGVWANIGGGSGTFITLTGDASSTASGGATTVTGLNNTSLAGLGTGLLKNTTGTGIPSIAAYTDVVGLWASGSCSGYLKNDGTCGAGGGTGTVSSVGWTGGIVTVATPTTTPAFTIAGTSGGVPYFNSATTWASSGALTGLMRGNGAGNAPTAAELSGDVVTSGSNASLVHQIHDNLTLVTYSGGTNNTPYTIAATDSVITCDASLGNVVINLPASAASGREITVKKLDSTVNTCTLTPSGSNTIDGAASVVVSKQWAAIKVADYSSSNTNSWVRTHVNQLGGDLGGTNVNAVVNSLTPTGDLVLTQNGVSVATFTAAGALANTLVCVGGKCGIGGLPVSKLTVPVAPTATPNYATLSIGSGAWDGATTGYFQGLAAGTHLGINAAAGSTADLFNFQKAGVSQASLDYTGNFVARSSITLGLPVGYIASYLIALGYNSNTELSMGSAVRLEWSSTNGYGGTVDTALSRDSAGVIDVGTGAQGSYAGSMKMTTINLTGSSFSFNGKSCTIVATVVTCT